VALAFELSDDESPVCPACEVPIEVDELAGHFDGPRGCPSCGTAVAVSPTPGWLGKVPQSKSADLVITVDKAGTARPSECKPVPFSCTQCGGGLLLNREQARVVECQYCGMAQHLPEALWRSVHPKRRRHPWYLRYPGGRFEVLEDDPGQGESV
jgi:predicted RNA-binding Zn-ribbon protein involved in translation (DUF1610 family)